MKTIKIRQAREDEIVEGASFYTPDSQDAGVHERVTITAVRRWRERGPEDNFKRPGEGMTGPERIQVSVQAETGWEGGRKPEALYVEDDDGIFEVPAYEWVGTALTVTLLVEGEDEVTAKAMAHEALDHWAETDAITAKEAYDKTRHYLSFDGELLAEAVPHWSPRGHMGAVASVSGTISAHEAIRQVLLQRPEVRR